MKNVNMIAAIGKNNELGKDNKLIWNLPNDLKFFKNMTMDKEIIMGSNTFYSLPKLLPGRKHIVLTRRNIENDKIKVIVYEKPTAEISRFFLNIDNKLEDKFLFDGKINAFPKFSNFDYIDNFPYQFEWLF